MKLPILLLITFRVLGVIAVIIAVPIIVWIVTADRGVTLIAGFVVIGIVAELIATWLALPGKIDTRDSP